MIRPPPDPSSARMDVVRAIEILYAIGERDLIAGGITEFGERSRDMATLAAVGEVAARHKDARAMAPAQLPVLSQLAQKFAVCDHWFASAPCQTWPNRWFVHAATADGHENNDPPHFPNVPTIFNRLEQAGIDSWKIYFHDIAQAHTVLQLFLLGSHFHSYRQFQADCQTGQLPAYSFIEPQYFADFGHPENDQHPPSVVTLGEQLIADVYNCLRASKVWRKTLLLITYDEHGGCYDHVAPSAAVPPQPPVPGQTFGFDRYGVRASMRRRSWPSASGKVQSCKGAA